MPWKLGWILYLRSVVLVTVSRGCMMGFEAP